MLFAPLQSTCPWLLSVSQSRPSLANKTSRPVHLNGLGSLQTNREDMFEDRLSTETLLTDKHAYFVNE